jgi:dolichol kinase
MISGFNSVPVELKTGYSYTSSDFLSFIPPLHEALKSVLGYVTTTSLDPSELDLLATVMINLLFLRQSPQAELLVGLLWVGGIGIFVSCQHLLEWEVELARIPKWKFAKRQSDSLINRLSCAVSALRNKPSIAPDSSDDEIDTRSRIKPLLRVRTTMSRQSSGLLSPSAAWGFSNGTISPSHITVNRPRRNTVSALDPQTKIEVQRRARPSGRLRSVPRTSFLALTAHEAQIRKYAYAGMVYLLVLLIIIGPTRMYVSSYALSSHEPFGWAIGYMLSGIPAVRGIVSSLNLADWVVLPPSNATGSYSEPFIQRGAYALYEEPANLRLLLCGYCLLVLLLGVTSVLCMASYIEVDTRRKGFHGVMVFMLLPTLFFDPCFFSLALSLILAAFLLLDLFRASQLPPISRPLTNFLAPYVDGRDHRGPVIVSHVFLLIGCAIPLWLSLSELQRIGSDPREGWDVSQRNLSMISGVVCVGMGDAAASLIGRRYGKTKWYWGGGKSLEGSLAFTVAVAVGLMFSYTWLRVWGWESWETYDLTAAMTKCLIAGSGASLLESVLTAANDNVVVPVGLWLLVRALKI